MAYRPVLAPLQPTGHTTVLRLPSDGRADLIRCLINPWESSREKDTSEIVDAKARQWIPSVNLLLTL